MNRFLVALWLILLGVSSCKKEVPKPLTPKQIEQRIDSIAAIKIQEVERRAQEDLRHRIKIEVKVKADSIVQAMKAEAAK